MQFLIIAHDGKDEGAALRRTNARPGHLERVEKFKAEGKHLYGGALLDESGNMIGSMMVVDFPSRQELDEWLRDEPYVTGGVWQEIEVRPFRVAETFVNN